MSVEPPRIATGSHLVTRWRRRFQWTMVLAALLGGWGLLERLAIAQEGVTAPGGPPLLKVWRDGMEGPTVSWSRLSAEVNATIISHERVRDRPREGEWSERIAFRAGTAGTGLYYGRPTPVIPIGSATRVALMIRSNRAGMQLLARVVLPSDVDPDTGQPTSLILAGSVYDDPDRWRRLDLFDLPLKAERQARVLRASSGRRVSLEGAYLDQVIVNLYGGPGVTVVDLDDLTISPVPTAVERGENPVARTEPSPEAMPGAFPEPNSAADGVGEAAVSPEASTTPFWNLVKLEDGRLSRLDSASYQWVDWSPAAISAPGADVEALARAGFDLLALPMPEPGAGSDDPSLTQGREAVERGMLLMLDAGRWVSDRALRPDRVVARLGEFPLRDATAFWNLGDRLGVSIDPVVRLAERERVREVTRLIRESANAERSALTTGILRGMFREYHEGAAPLSVIGLAPAAWGGSLGTRDLLEWYGQRYDLVALGNARPVFLGWTPATAPLEVTTSIWGPDGPPEWGVPWVQPDQVRLMVYAGLMAGHPGIAIQADETLTDPVNAATLLETAFLNAEIKLLSSILARRQNRPIPVRITVAPQRVSANPRVITPEAKPHPTLIGRAISTSDSRGSLVLIADAQEGSQWQPAQLAHRDVRVVVPAPEDAQAFEISLGGVRVLNRSRTAGGVQFELEEFAVTAAVLVTTDFGMIERLRQAVERIRPRAITMALDQSNALIRQIAGIHSQLQALGRGQAEGDLLLARAQNHLQAAAAALEREDFQVAWEEARRSSRPLRVLARAYHDQILRELIRVTTPTDPEGKATLITAVSCPPAVALNTLPQAAVWIDYLARWRFGRNRLPSGNFNDPDRLATEGWEEVGYGQTEPPAELVLPALTNDRKDRALKISVGPRDEAQRRALSPYLDHAPIALRSPGISIRSGQMIRVRVMVRMERPIYPGAGGVFVRDSIGGEALEFRTRQAIPEWREVVLYRRAPADGQLKVTLGLAGHGEAFFDNLVVETIDEPEDAAEAPPARSDR
ncbi:hypothetical protein Isop_0845 [Isosphaera pallida ATCC 43644]|uniref:Uncharacterized protein n=1 Tax=Isosphaera pallida (strain ATCC 43644 / DSM 9630 / IS1B) TaxID=575540 RepID=E8R2F0_ISOPI|nr:hypothetical protein [Isosphaera pallida]ADV61435.1 hypothetical protein Isop_0845 [Isosphaera pallida ATCC 43644]